MEMKIKICIESNRDWGAISAAIKRFLESEEPLLFIGDEEEVVRIIQRFPDNFNANLDLIQFCNLKLFKKGILGIRELHWHTAEMLLRMSLLSKVLSNRFIKDSNKFGRYSNRYFGMLSRRSSLDQISGGLSSIGLVIPHYVEPVHSATVVSRDFARSLLELNNNGLLTYERSFFALARSSNYKCIRIALHK
jgi:hypothetical protein